MVSLLSGAPCVPRLLADLAPDARLPDETGQTYHDNARLKSRAAGALTGMLAVADDSVLTDIDTPEALAAMRAARSSGS